MKDTLPYPTQPHSHHPKTPLSTLPHLISLHIHATLLHSTLPHFILSIPLLFESFFLIILYAGSRFPFLLLF